MVSLHTWTIVWILVLLFVFASVTDSTKHRRVPHHKHRHHHHHHHLHRKHPKFNHQASVSSTKNLSLKRNTRSELKSESLNMTKIIDTDNSPWFLNETSTLSSLNNGSSNNKIIASSSHFTTVESTISNHDIENISSIFNSSQTFDGFNYSSNTEKWNSTPNIQNKSVTIDVDNHSTRIVEESTLQDFAKLSLNSSQIQEPQNPAIDNNIDSVSPNYSQNRSDNQQQVVKDLETLFESTNGEKSLGIETPTVQLIRKKRSAFKEKEDDTPNKKSLDTLLDFNGPAILNDPEAIKDQEPSDEIHIRVKRDGSEVDEAPSGLSSLESNYLQDLENSFALSALEVQAHNSRNVERKSRQSPTNVDSSMNLTRIERDADEKEDESKINNDVAARSEIAAPSDGTLLKDDNSVSKYKLDDVYPDIIEDPEHPTALVQLARAKRFGDGLVNPEVPDASYANEADNSRTADEPYAEDNRFIDSVLSKVDYRNADEQNEREARSGRSEVETSLNKEEINPDEREETSFRNKRGVLRKRTRKKTNAGRRGRRKQNSHKKRAKKHRSKIKRASKNLSEREINFANSPAETKGDYNDNNVGVELYENDEDKVVSPHDGRRRRIPNDEGNENFYSNLNEDLGQVRKDVRESGDVRNIPEVDCIEEETAGCSQELGKLSDDSKTRAKRDNALQELKYYQNIREANSGQIQSTEVVDKNMLSPKAAEPIQEIKQIVEKLLVKVEDLHNFIGEGNAAEKQQESRNSGTLANYTRIINEATGIPSMVKTPSPSFETVENSSPKLVNVGRRPKPCWRHPTSCHRHIEPSKNVRPARNLRNQRCGNKVRQNRKSHRKWDRWTDWSSCSVTCGRGRQIRWRHCIRNCLSAETEMEEKACQFPACAPGKFLGIFG